MKKLFIFGIFCLGLTASVQAQNWTTVTATNITDLNQQKLAAGQLCFLATDQNDNPISIGIGGGGQALRRQYCSQVTAGVVTAFTVPNPTSTLPAGVYYRVTVKDSSTGQEVLRYTQVSFAGTSFNFDNYAPVNLGAPAPLSGTSVTGNLSVTGNVSATGTLTGSNIPGIILQQIFDSGTGLTPRTTFNCMAGIKCSDNAGTSRTDLRLGTLTTVTFSATPTFDASTASTFKLTLTGNVTSSTLSNAVAGEPLAFEICQDATGARTFVPPANVKNWAAIPSGANLCSVQHFYYDGTNALPSVLGILPSGSVVSWNGDTGLSRTAAGTVAVGNGTQADASGTLLASNIKQGQTFFQVLDNLGVSHFFISNASPYVNTFVTGNGSGSVILGTNAAIRVNDAAGGGADFAGATSSVTTVKPLAVASGILTLPAATDTLVGKAITDTLTNKTLNGSASGNAVDLLNEQASSGALTGNSTDQTFYTYTLPAGTLAQGKCLDIEAWGTHSSGAAAVTFKIFFGATLYANNLSSAAGGSVYFKVHVCNNSGSTTAQHGSNIVSIPGTTFSPFAPLTSAENTGNAVVIKGTFNVASTDQFTPGDWVVRLSQ